MNSGWPICDTQLEGLISGFTEKPQSPTCLGFINHRILNLPWSQTIYLCWGRGFTLLFMLSGFPSVHHLLFFLSPLHDSWKVGSKFYVGKLIIPFIFGSPLPYTAQQTVEGWVCPYVTACVLDARKEGEQWIATGPGSPSFRVEACQFQ